MSQALYLKWRPKTWDEVVGQDHVIQTLRNAVYSNHIAHAYLFSGPRGTGKTTTARLLAKAVNCLAESFSDRPDNRCSICQAINQGRFLDLIEIDAASNTSVEDVRDLRDKINFSPNEGRFKVYIIDEVHMLSTAAFNALLKTLEEPPPHAIFVLATTEVHKIPATVLSRCQRHEFRRLPAKTMIEFLRRKNSEEGFEIEDGVLELIARQATGSLRDAISLYDQLTAAGAKVTLEQAQAILGTVTSEAVRDVVEAMVKNDTAMGLLTLSEAVNGGADPRQFARQIVDYLRGILLIKMGNERLLDAPIDARSEMKEDAEALSISDIVAALKAFYKASAETKVAWLPSLSLELAFLESCIKGSLAASSAPINAPQQTSQNPSRPFAKPSIEKSSTQSHSSPIMQDRSSDDGVLPPIIRNPTAELSFQEIRGHWRDILQAVRQYDPRTQALLNSCMPLGLERGALVLGFRSDLLRDKMEKDHNLAKACQAAEQILGKSVTLRCVLVGAWSPKEIDQNEAPPVEEDGMVATAIRDFGAQVVDIEQLPPDSSP
jgi:DNA polymerase-3 subunit gamma/tau